MKVAFFSSYPPENDGIARYTKRFTDHFPKDVETAVFAKKKGIIENERGIYRTISFKPKDIIATYKKLISFKPDIIHIQYVIPLYGFYLIVLWPLVWTAKYFTKSKLVITFHEVKRETRALCHIGSWYYFILSIYAARIYVHTDEAKNILIKKCHVRENKVLVIPHGTFSFKSTANREDYIRKEYNIDKKNNILFFGYIHVDKGINYLVDAFSNLLKKKHSLRKTTQLLIVGSVRPRGGIFRIFGFLDFRYFKKIKDQIKRSNLQDDVMFIDYIPDDLIYSFLKIASCIVLPYTNGEQSGVLNSAISANTPIIASNIGGIGETLKDVGVLVDPGDIEAISLSIEKIVENHEYAKKLSDGYALLDRSLQPEEILKRIIVDYKSLI